MTAAPDRPVVVLTGASTLARHVVDHYVARLPEGSILIVEERPRSSGRLMKFASRRIRKRGYLSFVDAVALRALDPLVTRLRPQQRGARPWTPDLVVEDLNDPEVARFVRQRRGRLAILNLCSIVSAEQLERLAIPVVNVHPGINPRYRGAGCLWALKEENFHLVGATLHKVDSGIDTGAPIAYALIDPLLPHSSAGSIVVAAQIAGADLAIRLAKGLPTPSIPPELVGLESRLYPYPGLTTLLRASRNLRRAKRARERADGR